MASTSSTADQPERESINTSQGTAPSPSTSVISSSPSLCSSCFDWVSFFIPWFSVESNSMPSASSAGLEQDDEVNTVDFHGITPSAPTAAFQSNSMASTSTGGLKQEEEVNTSVFHVIESSAPTFDVQFSSMACTAGGLQQEEGVNTGAFHGIAKSAPTFTFQCNSMAYTPCAGLKQDNEVNTGTNYGNAPSAPSSAVQSYSMACTSTGGLNREEVNTGAFHGNAPSAPTSAFQSNSMASTSTAGLEQENECNTAAFHGIAPSAPASEILPLDKPLYHVFLNHRGDDVKTTLAYDLYRILTGSELRVFLDSMELKSGDFLPRTIEEAMTSTLVHIAIFSERYAESPWCLAELSFMLKSGATIIPIFYHVDPSDLRYIDQGKGMYVHAFKNHEQKGRIKPEKLKEWKKALHTVSFYYGEVIKSDDKENLLKKNIVNKVSTAISYIPPVGLRERVQEFETITPQSVEVVHGVQIVVIQGISGSGKTTLAKELYTRKRSSFMGSSFVCDVQEAATKRLLHMKQLKILKDLGVQGTFDNIKDGKEILSRHLKSVKVLIVLDNVDKMEYLEDLLPAKDRLERGSVIIVTTRTHVVLESWDISSIYEMKPLNPLDAEQLFCSHAFLKSCPRHGFDDLVKEFVKKCKGLPHALKVFGRQLRGESRRESWESLLDEISRSLPEEIKNTPKLNYDELYYEDKEIKERLEVSYNALDYEVKEMFLDIACFFTGEEESLAIEVWNGLGLNGLLGLETLLNKCLVELDDGKYISMNDNFKNLGREIANRQAPYRLWSSQQTIDVQNQEQERICIQGIMATSSLRQCTYGVCLPASRGGETPLAKIRSSGEVNDFGWCSHSELVVNTNSGIWSLERSLAGLKILVTSGKYFKRVMAEKLRELIWLRWFQIEEPNLPARLSLTNLRVLELFEDNNQTHHLEELWGKTDSEIPVQLIELRISECYKFKAFPNSIGRLSYLKNIVIIKAHRISSLPIEFCFLRSLEQLVLYKCHDLSSLPSNFGNLRKLRHLCLSGCGQLSKLPLSFRNLTHLKYLNLKLCLKLSPNYEDSIPENIDIVHLVD